MLGMMVMIQTSPVVQGRSTSVHSCESLQEGVGPFFSRAKLNSVYFDSIKHGNIKYVNNT